MVLIGRKWLLVSLSVVLSVTLSPVTMANDGEKQTLAEGSLFDQLFGRKTDSGIKYTIPYPFENLLHTLDQLLQSASDKPRQFLATVLIPQGRSLQRDAAYPEYYRYPRIVVAVDTEPPIRKLVQNRLFMGYQEKAEQIEVISYNPRAARFEFQEIANYGSNKVPVVRQSERGLCTSCHQNEATIFPSFGWNETNAGRLVAGKLRELMDSYHGINISGSGSGAGNVDLSTDRASMLDSLQKVWSKGCTAESYPNAEYICRAGLFRKMLLYRLGATYLIGTDPLPWENYYRGQIAENWRTNWPDGLPIPNPNLHDRIPDPVIMPVKLPEALNPQTLRVPKSFWYAQSDMDRAIKGLADSFLLQSDINRLDRGLSDALKDSDQYTKQYQGLCTFDISAGSGNKKWIEVECDIPSHDGNRSEIIAQLYVNSEQQITQGLSWLYLQKNAQFVQADLADAKVFNSENNALVQPVLMKRYKDTHARTRDGMAMTHAKFSWKNSVETINQLDYSTNGDIELTIINDLPLIEIAVDQLLEDAKTGLFDGFNNQPIDGVKLMTALFEKLRIPVD